MTIFRFSLLGFIFVVSGCAATGDPYYDSARNQQAIGSIVGGILGGVVGHQFGGGRGRTAMTVLGATVGAVIGGNLARDRYISDQERRAAYLAFESTPSNTAVPWNDPDRDMHGRYIPMRTYRNSDGRYCREYQQVVVINGREQNAYGTACRQADGSWQIEN